MTRQDMSQRMMGTSDAQRLRFALVAAEFLERMGTRLRERRDELGLSRAEVARRMPGKVNENQVYRWENGKHQPNPDTLEALAKILERDVSYFLTPANDETENDASEQPPDLMAELSPRRLNERLAGIEERLDRLQAVLEALAGAQVVDAALRALARAQSPGSSKRPRRAA